MKRSEYAKQHNIPVYAKPPALTASIRISLAAACEAGVLEDPWDEPPEEAFAWTTDPRKAPNEPEYLEIDFETRQAGRPQWHEDGRRAVARIIEQDRRQAWRRPYRSRRESAGRHQVPRTLRSPCGVILHDGPPRTRIAVPVKPSDAIQDDGRPGIRRPHL